MVNHTSLVQVDAISHKFWICSRETLSNHLYLLFLKMKRMKTDFLITLILIMNMKRVNSANFLKYLLRDHEIY